MSISKVIIGIVEVIHMSSVPRHQYQIQSSINQLYFPDQDVNKINNNQ